MPLPFPAEIIARIPPPYYTPTELKSRKERDSIKARLDQMTAARAAAKATSSSQSLVTIPTSFPTTTTILKVITPEFVIPSIKEKVEPSFLNEFKPILFPSISEYTRAGKVSSSIYFPLVRPDKFKLLGQEIKSYKECADEALKAHFAIIYREGQKLFIGTGHPHYSFAKTEKVAKECERRENNLSLLSTLKQN